MSRGTVIGQPNRSVATVLVLFAGGVFNTYASAYNLAVSTPEQPIAAVALLTGLWGIWLGVAAIGWRTHFAAPMPRSAQILTGLAIPLAVGGFLLVS